MQAEGQISFYEKELDSQPLPPSSSQTTYSWMQTLRAELCGNLYWVNLVALLSRDFSTLSCGAPQPQNPKMKPTSFVLESSLSLIVHPQKTFKEIST